MTFERLKELEYSKILDKPLTVKELDFNTIEYLESLGKGQFGSTFKVRQYLPNGESRIIAVKQLQLIDGGNTMKKVMFEYDIMRSCDYPNAIKLYGMYRSTRSISNQNALPSNYAFIFMENCDLGTLERYISKHFPTIPPSREFIEHIFIELLVELWYLHSNKSIVHRDIKPENILLATNPLNASFPIVKIADLGGAKMILKEDERLVTLVGSYAFMAPEISAVYKIGSYTYKIDLWSLACSMYYMITHITPFGKSDKQIKMKENRIPPSFNDAVWDEYPGMRKVIENLLIYDDAQRWGWPQIFRSKYIRQLLINKEKRERIERNEVVDDIEIEKKVDEENRQRSYDNLFKVAYVSKSVKN